MTGLFKHLLCPQHGTWPHDATEHMKCGGCDWRTEWFISYTLFHCTTWLGKYFIGQCGSRLRGILLFCFYPWNSSSLSALGWEKVEGPSSMAQWQRIRLPMQEIWETWVRSLGQEDPLKKGMATHPRILAWRIPCTEEPSFLHNLIGSKESDMTEST